MSAPPWDRENDTELSWQAFQDYLRMPKPRTLEGLQKGYRKVRKGKKRPPTVSIKTLENWYHRYKWKDRAKAFDAHEGKKAIAVASDAKIEIIRERAKTEFYAMEKVREDLARTGMSSIAIGNALRNDIIAYLADGRKSKHIRDFDDVLGLLRSLVTFESKGFEYRSQAGLIDRIIGSPAINTVVGGGEENAE